MHQHNTCCRCLSFCSIVLPFQSQPILQTGSLSWTKLWVLNPRNLSTSCKSYSITYLFAWRSVIVSFQKSIIDSLSCKKRFQSIFKLSCFLLQNTNVDVNLWLNFVVFNRALFLFCLKVIDNFLNFLLWFRLHSFKRCLLGF